MLRVENSSVYYTFFSKFVRKLCSKSAAYLCSSFTTHVCSTFYFKNCRDTLSVIILKRIGGAPGSNGE